MFLGLRDIVFAKGRFLLMTSVLGLLTLLLVMLTGLTGGLGKQNTAALESLDADHFVFASPGESEPEVSFTSSVVSQAELDTWGAAAGVDSAVPVGFSPTKVEAASATSAALIGIPTDADLLTRSVGQALSGSTALTDGTVVLGTTVAQEAGAEVGDPLTIAGQDFTVGGIVADTYYSHQPVIWANTSSWQAVSRQPSDILGTVLAVDATTADFTHLEEETNSIAVSTRDSLTGLAAYQSEQGSLKTMQGFLYGISALVTISFLTVWTIQRTRDLAVLRALGGSSSYILRDALAQAALILFCGALAGALLGWALGYLASTTVPFDLTTYTLMAPAAGIWLLGMAGAFIATRRVTTIDPMLALGGN